MISQPIIKIFCTLAVAALFIQLPACGGGGGASQPPPTVSSDSHPDGEALYNSVCFACHGSDGAGRFVRLSIQGTMSGKIISAINTVPSMEFLSYLNVDEINALTGYLARLSSETNSQRLTVSGNGDRGEALFRQNCSGCHSMNGGDNLRIGPDLLFHSSNCADGATSRTSTCELLMAFITEPQAMASHAYTEAGLAEYPYIMPELRLTDVDALDIATFIGEKTTPLLFSEPVVLTPATAAYEQTKELYFNRCAGCHGLYRGGATGPDIGEENSNKIGTDGLAAMMRHGTPGGMPNFGTAGILTETEISNLAAYLQLPPPEPPAWGWNDIVDSWEEIIPDTSRPDEPQHAEGINWRNFFGVVLRDAGEVAIFDGDSHKEISRVDVGFAVHILRSSASGRYFYAIGRDGWVNMIDLWMAAPAVVARVRGCYDARSVESSKFAGYQDKYLIEGCYWPAQYVIYNGLTLQPQIREDLLMVDIDGVEQPEVRVAAIVASEFAPEWVINQKESGYVGIVDYSRVETESSVTIENIAAEKFLHDGGWDHSKRYFITAANASNKMVVVDTQNKEVVATIDESEGIGKLPHPGRGANWEHTEYGWVNATPHLESPFVSVYGTDPVNKPDHAWKVVRKIDLPAAGSLFIKTHPASPWVLVDMTMSSSHDKQICAIDKNSLVLDRCFDVATAGKATHMEFNEDGSEVWISDWAVEGGGQVILDSRTLEVKKRIALPATTGKFNVTNTSQDVY